MPFCEFCGKKLEENEVCSCRTGQQSDTPNLNAFGNETPSGFAPEESPVTYDSNPQPPAKNKKLVKILIGAGAAVVVILLAAAVVFMMNANSYKKTITKLTSLINKQETDIDALVSAALPDFASSSYKKAVKILNKSEEFAEDYESLPDAIDRLYENVDDEYGEGWAIKFDTTDQERIASEDLEDIADNYIDLYDYYLVDFIEEIDDYDKYDYEDLGEEIGISAEQAKELCSILIKLAEQFESAKVTDGYELTGRLVLTDAEGDTLEKTERINVSVIKLNGDWTIDYLSLISEVLDSSISNFIDELGWYFY